MVNQENRRARTKMCIYACPHIYEVEFKKVCCLSDFILGWKTF